MEKISAEQVRMLYKEAGMLRNVMRRFGRYLNQIPASTPRNRSHFDSLLRRYYNKHRLLSNKSRDLMTFPVESGRQFKIF